MSRAEHVVTLEPHPRLEDSLTFDHKQAFDHKQEAALEISPENSEPDTSRDPDPLIPFPLGLGMPFRSSSLSIEPGTLFPIPKV